MLRDRETLSQRLNKIRQRCSGKGEENLLKRQLISLEKRVEASVLKRQKRLEGRPRISFPESLPIFTRQNEIIRAVRENQVVIISGETGSGKSTQIPKMCLKAGRGIIGKIGCTQPRRIAATTIAERISEELGEEIGQSVGYKIRFRDRTHPDAYIKIMTDGMLLAETQADPDLYEYDTLIIDEAHERGLNIDFLLGILRGLLDTRPELKLIITSATLDTEKFSSAFKDAPVVKVGGRLYPVETEYMPVDPELEDAGDITYVDMALKAVDRLREKRHFGDVLIFMPTEQDILETCERLEGRKVPGTTIMPLFARLSSKEQGRIYRVKGRKIVVATNVAETSLTIPGIKYVIDTGLARISQYLPSTRTTSLPITRISKSSADQRKGRCGRVQKGLCIRLYSEEDYESRPLFTPPEILRSNLAEVILRMMSLNLGDIASFPFVDHPHPKSVKDGFDLLRELGAVKRDGRGYVLTEKGRIMAQMPLDPKISRMMLEARKEGCVREVAVIASALSIRDPRERPLERAAQADQMHAPFKDQASDFITLLNIWNRYHRSWKRLKTQNRMRKFCKEHFLSFPRMREWGYIHDQIKSILKAEKISFGGKRSEEMKNPLYEGIHKSILSGYLSNIAVKKDRNICQGTRGREVMIFPGSTLFNRAPQWIVAAEMVKTSRLFARTTARIDSAWLEPLGADLCRSDYSEPHWEKNRGEVRAFERVTLFGLVIVPRRSVSYGPFDPEESHSVFVRSALVEGAVKEPIPFLTHNRNLAGKLIDVENKLRRRDILVDEEEIAAFYSKRLEGVHDIRTLKKLVRKRGDDTFLRMREEDLIRFPPDRQELAQYPKRVTIGGNRFRTAYQFAPGSEDDGVTISIPSSFAARVPAEKLEWMVPGLFREKVTALVKGLPKRYRKQLVPVSETVEAVLQEMEQGEGSLLTSLAQFIYRRFRVDIPASVWEGVDIPEYLKMRMAITDYQGKELVSGRDIRLLEQRDDSAAQGKRTPLWEKAQKEWERRGLTAWDFDNLPESISLGPHLMAFPALEPVEAGVNVRLFENHHQALSVHMKGVRTLFLLHFKKDLKFLRRNLSLPEKGSKWAGYFGGIKVIERALYENILRGLFHINLRTREAFDTHARNAGQTMLSQGKAVRDLALKVLEAYHQTRSAIHTIETGNPSNRAVRTLCAHIRADLEALMPEDFLERYDQARLAQIPRYLKAMEIRAERGANDPGRDRTKMEQAEVFIKDYNRIALSSHASEEKREALDAYRWMIEEFKVSLLAQELKTAFPVSKKRLTEKKQEIDRMV